MKKAARTDKGSAPPSATAGTYEFDAKREGMTR
jgi:hypothetical protein